MSRLLLRRALGGAAVVVGVLTLMFFYISALIFIFGAEINSARRRAEAARLRAERAAERSEVHAG